MIVIWLQNERGSIIEMVISHLLRDMPCPWCLENSAGTNDRIELNTFPVLEIGVRCTSCRAEIIDISTVGECQYCDS